MTASDLTRFLGPMRRRVAGMVARGVIALVDDSLKAQGLQLTLLADEAHGGVERFQDYGFTSVPRPGAEAVVVFVGGLRSHGVVVACEDRRYRLCGLESGEVALYDDQGQMVKLARDGIVVATSKDVAIQGKAVTIHATTAAVIADTLDLGAAGGMPVARVGDPVVDGKIAAGSAKVKAA